MADELLFDLIANLHSMLENTNQMQSHLSRMSATLDKQQSMFLKLEDLISPSEDAPQISFTEDHAELGRKTIVAASLNYNSNSVLLHTSDSTLQLDPCFAPTISTTLDNQRSLLLQMEGPHVGSIDHGYETSMSSIGDSTMHLRYPKLSTDPVVDLNSGDNLCLGLPTTSNVTTTSMKITGSVYVFSSPVRLNCASIANCLNSTAIIQVALQTPNSSYDFEVELNRLDFGFDPGPVLLALANVSVLQNRARKELIPVDIGFLHNMTYLTVDNANLTHFDSSRKAMDFGFDHSLNPTAKSLFCWVVLLFLHDGTVLADKNVTTATVVLMFQLGDNRLCWKGGTKNQMSDNTNIKALRNNIMIVVQFRDWDPTDASEILAVVVNISEVAERFSFSSDDNVQHLKGEKVEQSLFVNLVLHSLVCNNKATGKWIATEALVPLLCSMLNSTNSVHNSLELCFKNVMSHEILSYLLYVDPPEDHKVIDNCWLLFIYMHFESGQTIVAQLQRNKIIKGCIHIVAFNFYPPILGHITLIITQNLHHFDPYIRNFWATSLDAVCISHKLQMFDSATKGIVKARIVNWVLLFQVGDNRLCWKGGTPDRVDNPVRESGEFHSPYGSGVQFWAHIYFAEVKQEKRDTFELAPDPIDGECLLTRTVIIFYQSYGLFKEYAKPIQSSFTTIKIELVHYGINDATVEHSTILMATLHFLAFIQFFDTEMAKYPHLKLDLYWSGACVVLIITWATYCIWTNIRLLLQLILYVEDAINIMESEQIRKHSSQSSLNTMVLLKFYLNLSRVLSLQFNFLFDKQLLSDLLKLENNMQPLGGISPATLTHSCLHLEDKVNLNGGSNIMNQVRAQLAQLKRPNKIIEIRVVYVI